MSAFLCSQRHIAAVATALSDLGRDPQVTGETLLRENERSLRYRYEERADPYFGDEGLTAPFVFEGPVREGGVAWLLCQVDCYAYQASEHPTWGASEAYGLCEQIRAHLAGMSEDEAPATRLDAIRESREYKAAPWGL